MTLVLWLMDEEMMDKSSAGMLVANGDMLSKPIEVQVLPIDSEYNPGDYLRVVEFSITNGEFIVNYIKGKDEPEGDALVELSLSDHNDFDEEAFVRMAKDRFTLLLNESLEELDDDIRPLLKNKRWLEENTLVPFWSCSGHIGENGGVEGYLCLSGTIDNLQKVKLQLEGMFDLLSICFLNHSNDSGLIYIHPVLYFEWAVYSQECIDSTMSKINKALESGLFNY